MSPSSRTRPLRQSLPELLFVLLLMAGVALSLLRLREPAPAGGAEIHVRLDARNRIHLDGVPVDLPTLQAQLEQQLARQPRPVVIDAHRHGSPALTREISERARLAGASRVLIQPDPPPAEGRH